MLEIAFPRYGPKRIIREFSDYTLREVDLRREADNAETFAANFTDEPDIVFPKIYREFSGERVLTMEFFDGHRPDSKLVQAMPLRGPRAAGGPRRRGHHPDDLQGRLLPRRPASRQPASCSPGPKAGFIDLGMVGRMHDELRRTLLYYYYALVMGDAENAARYLSAAAEPGRGGDPAGFRRDVAEISSRWRRNANFDSFSLGQLILESVSRGARIPDVLPGGDGADGQGAGHVRGRRPDPPARASTWPRCRSATCGGCSSSSSARCGWRTEGLRGAPDLVDALVKMPLLITEGLRVLEKTTKRSTENPFAGLRGTLIAGFSLVAGAIILGFVGAHAWPFYVPFFVIAFVLAVRKGS